MADISGKADHMDVAYVANLARLYLSADEVRLFQSQLDQIVAYVNQIRAVNLDGIEPTSHPAPLHNVFRKDQARPGLSNAEALANAPAGLNDQFMVPKIVE
jgi:aspartyl-tRNA(Asn)/glutamyl-tRNA(Gln) amidotransferase subunit C